MKSKCYTQIQVDKNNKVVGLLFTLTPSITRSKRIQTGCITSRIENNFTLYFAEILYDLYGIIYLFYFHPLTSFYKIFNYIESMTEFSCNYFLSYRLLWEVLTFAQIHTSKLRIHFFFSSEFVWEFIQTGLDSFGL